ncbi:MAG TPA: flagellar biosynthesis regulator FlaF [Methylosinus sp.]|jgi:flagellar biosynthesis activator protein FlaF|uniref:flagellar biosynthesis regulator FlaF n=1 Tax=Hyphomicrobiales TaxID=356 RepID=UPI002F9275CF
MYRNVYAQTVEESPAAVRGCERALLERGIRLLAVAKVKGVRSSESFEATANVRRIWTVFIEDLGSDGNALPEALRASLISIGLWVLRELEAIDCGRSDNFDGVIEINQMIADGLS